MTRLLVLASVLALGGSLGTAALSATSALSFTTEEPTAEDERLNSRGSPASS